MAISLIYAFGPLFAQERSKPVKDWDGMTFFFLLVAIVLLMAVVGATVFVIWALRRRKPLASQKAGAERVEHVGPRPKPQLASPLTLKGGTCMECGTPVQRSAQEAVCAGCAIQKRITRLAEEGPVAGGVPTAPYLGLAPAPAELMPLFPHLEILGLVGKGGMGVVYKARQPRLDRLVALKILPPDVCQDTAFTERFTREARALARLSHSHIVAVHDFGETAGQFYFLMEYVDGVNLRQLMRLSPPTCAEAIRLVLQICEALQYAHDEGIAHRDIKPENILLDRKGRVKIADFGLAKLLARGPGDHTLTASHQILGTLRYMAPEQIETPQQVDHRADIYAVGVVLYELLTGELPLGRFDLPSQKAGVNASFDNVVLRALARDPQLRYQRVSELKADLEASVREPLANPPALATPRPNPRIDSDETTGPLEPSPDADGEKIRARVKGPAIGLHIVGFLPLPSLLFSLPGLLGNPPGTERDVFTVIVVLCFLHTISWSVVILLGAWRMMHLKSSRLAFVASCLAMLPSGPWVLVGLPVGIWSLVVLLDPEVGKAFQAKAS